ncbi:MAG: hypothetical protein AAGF92_08150 [Myxococcota bacterium]
MSATPRCQRRDFLRYAAAQVISLPLLQTMGCGSDDGLQATQEWLDARPRVDTYFADARQSLGDDRVLDAAERIGREYIDVRVVPVRQSAVEELLTPVTALINEAASDEEAVAELRALVGEDFRDLQVVDVRGWTLSETEAQVAALVWLTS